MRLGPQHTSERRGPSRPLTALALAGLMVLSGPSAVNAATPAPDPGAVARAQAEASRLAQGVSQQQQEVNAALKAIDRLAGVAETAKQAEQDARKDELAAVAEQLNAEAEAESATKQLKAQHKALGNWAAQLYTSGIVDPNVYQLEILLSSSDFEEITQRLGLLDSASKQQVQVINKARQLQAEKQTAADRSDAAKEKAKAAHQRALAAAARASAALQQQSARVAQLKQLLAAERAKLSAAQVKAQQLEAQRRLAAANARASRESSYDSSLNPNNKITGPTSADCPGADISGYANGRIPTELLCPLWAAPGHMLRADAAYQFNLLSQAYAVQFGHPMCVTDSYRTLAAQIAVKLAKPYLAATPGKSNHGWARAVDLCGGIQTFGSTEHEWMRANAGRFGWYHPAWAQQGGSKPEPWHWEFAW